MMSALAFAPHPNPLPAGGERGLARRNLGGGRKGSGTGLLPACGEKVAAAG